MIEVSERLDFIQGRSVAAWEFQKLDAEGVFGATKADGIECCLLRDIVVECCGR
jgi:hypothetical protein